MKILPFTAKTSRSKKIKNNKNSVLITHSGIRNLQSYFLSGTLASQEHVRQVGLDVGPGNQDTSLTMLGARASMDTDTGAESLRLATRDITENGEETLKTRTHGDHHAIDERRNKVIPILQRIADLSQLLIVSAIAHLQEMYSVENTADG